MPNTCNLNQIDTRKPFEMIEKFRTHLKKMQKLCKGKYFKSTCRYLISLCDVITNSRFISDSWIKQIEDDYWALRRNVIVNYRRGHERKNQKMF